MDTDHIDGNGLNNTRENLRVVTHRENLNNSHRIVKKQSEYPGVCWHAHHKKWVARIYIKSEGKQVHIGYFSTEEEAYAAYKERSDALLH